MPRRVLTTAERTGLEGFPKEIPHTDVVTFFTLSARDLAQIPARSSQTNQIGFAVQLCALRYLGFCPDVLTGIPQPALDYVARQLVADPAALGSYGTREHTRTDHLQKIMEYLGFRKPTSEDLSSLQEWLSRRALEHDRPGLLLRMACERLHRDRILRPGTTILERLVATARANAQQETFRLLSSLFTEDRKSLLDSLLVPEEDWRISRSAWLRQSARSNTPGAIRQSLEKIRWLRRHGVDQLDLGELAPNRLKFLAQVGRRSTNQALQRMPEERRYPIVTSFLRQSLFDVTDETIDLFDRCLAEAYNRAERDLNAFRSGVAKATNEKVLFFRNIAGVVLDPEVGDAELRSAIYEQIPQKVLQKALVEAASIIRPIDDEYFDFLKSRYTYLRQFSPTFLATLEFEAGRSAASLLEAISLLRRINAENRRTVSPDAPTDFIPPKWRPYVMDRDGRIDRQYFELCVLWELRGALRSGNVWVRSSRRYADPESYLVPASKWADIRTEVCRQTGTPEAASARLAERVEELNALLPQTEQMLSEDGEVYVKDGLLHVSPHRAETKPESLLRLEERMDARLPLVELSEVLIEVDRWTGFSKCFEHAGESRPPSPEVLPLLYASIVAQGCNIGVTRMAQVADIGYERMAWCANWHLREETLKSAVDTLVNYQYEQPLSRHWGGGVLSSSDGQRFPVTGKVANATAIPRYFGYGRGVTFYTWTADQFSQYGTKVIPATARDATYVLDAILENETELPLVEHATDTAGYTEMIFALFDLLGMQFCPRIRDLKDQQLYYVDSKTEYPNLAARLKGRINQDRIRQYWDDLLRVMGSLKTGWVTSSLFIGKLQAYPRQNALARAIQEYGKLIKTIFVLRYVESEDYRRRINTQLNKGEALHALRRLLFFGNEGKIRRKQEEAQTNQAGCLNLLTNAVIVWNTVYMAKVLEALREEGCDVDEDDLRRLSPARYEHVNPYGKYRFDLDKGLPDGPLRPLREP
jgi:TnpA family transposase